METEEPSLVKDDEALNVSSVYFFLKGAIIYTPDCTEPAGCWLTHLPQHRYKQEEEFGCFYANTNSSVQWKLGTLERGYPSRIHCC